jgi:hypothetical protein
MGYRVGCDDRNTPDGQDVVIEIMSGNPDDGYFCEQAKEHWPKANSALLDIKQIVTAIPFSPTTDEYREAVRQIARIVRLQDE